MIKVRINDREFYAQIDGVLQDISWDGRDTKTINFENYPDYDTVKDLFVEGCHWESINEWDEQVQKADAEGNPMFDEDGNPIMEAITHRDVYDESDYSVAGAITDYRDGRVSVKMGKLTDVEEVLEDIYGGIS